MSKVRLTLAAAIFSLSGVSAFSQDLELKVLNDSAGNAVSIEMKIAIPTICLVNKPPPAKDCGDVIQKIPPELLDAARAKLPKQ